MKIKWNGHASFTITASDGTVIVTDPYEPGAFDGGIAYDAVDDKADVALVSHSHADHNYTQSLQGDPAVLTAGGSAKGIEFIGVDTAHDEKDGAERGKNVLFAFEVDGIRIGFMGDLGHQLSDGQLAALGKIDLLLTPVGGVFTLNEDGAASLVEQVKPRLVIPMHFKTGKCGFPLSQVDEFAKRMTNVKKTGQSEVEVSAADLPASGPEVWILEHAK
jgi:L-ascorbate metabolism protein UlaG (beta-lactamase superfamily)